MGNLRRDGGWRKRPKDEAVPSDFFWDGGEVDMDIADKNR